MGHCPQPLNLQLLPMMQGTLPTSVTAISLLHRRPTPTTTSNSSHRHSGLLTHCPPTPVNRHSIIVVLAVEQTMEVTTIRVKGQGLMGMTMTRGQGHTNMKVTDLGRQGRRGQGRTTRRRIKGQGTEVMGTGQGCHSTRSVQHDLREHPTRVMGSRHTMTTAVRQGELQG